MHTVLCRLLGLVLRAGQPSREPSCYSGQIVHLLKRTRTAVNRLERHHN